MSLKRILRVAGAVLMAATFCAGARGATVTGTVKGPDGAPFMGAFVQAQNAQTRMTFMALSDAQGRYRVEKVPAGEYRIAIKALGFKADAQSGVKIAADQNLSEDFALAKGNVRWNDLNVYQA